MAKSRKRKRAGQSGGAGFKPAAPRKSSATARTTLAVLIMAVVAGTGWWIWDLTRAESAFAEYAAAGEGELSGIVEEPDLGRDHLAPGEGHGYGTPFPTSGPHAPVPTPPGFYDERQPAIGLVHALEHGNIVIYYDRPGAEARALVERWTGLFGGTWDGVLATPAAALGERVVLTAWRRRLELERFDPEIAAAFIERFRGRGPENPVR